MSYFFTSESVSEGHPDKVADQISDALLDEFLRHDPESHVACETLVTTGLAVVSGEVSCSGYVDVQSTVRDVIREIGYTKGEYKFEAESCGVLSAIHEQSADINQGVSRKEKQNQGAGDQGMMFGYACRETDELMPLPITLSHIILQELSKIRREGRQMRYLRPDAKSQVTVQYSDAGKPERIDTIVVSTQHDPDVEQKQIHKDIEKILLSRAIKRLPSGVQKLFGKEMKLFVNPTGNFVIGGPHGDTGLTGRKIIVDTYGGRGAHGGGAFSGKDPSKVDRSAAYAARYIAKNLVAAGVAKECLVQVSYAIGVAEPVSIFVDTYGTASIPGHSGEAADAFIASRIRDLFDLRPAAIIERFQLKNPIYEPCAAYGHFGREPYVKDGMQFFGWEKLDSVERIKEEFGL